MQSVVPLMPFFFFFFNQQPATLGFTAGKNNRFPAINKNPGRFDSMAAFLMQCHFQDFHFYLKSHNSRTEDFPLFGFPAY